MTIKNLSKLLPVFLLLLFVGLACKNPFARQESVVINNTTPASNENSTITPTTTTEAINEKATSLPKPVYPAAAKAVRASGEVVVNVEVDEKGNVTSAKAASGHPLLRQSAEQAARQAKFKPSAAKTKSEIVYKFPAQ